MPKGFPTLGGTRFRVAEGGETNAEHGAGAHLGIARRERCRWTIPCPVIHFDEKFHLLTCYLKSAQQQIGVSRGFSRHEEGLRVAGPAADIEHLTRIAKRSLRLRVGKMVVQQAVINAKKLVRVVEL